MLKKIGIIGAGFIGQACTKLFIQAGYQVMICNSRDKITLFSVASSLGCKVGSLQETVDFGDIILVAIPFINYQQLPTDLLSNKIVLDAMNYYPDRDGRIQVLDTFQTTTSELVAKHLYKSKIVKVFNAILQQDILKDAKPNDKTNRRALPIAGNDNLAKQTIFKLIDQVGFDYIDVGKLSESWRFERAKPAYCVPLNLEQLKLALSMADRKTELSHNSWKSYIK
ncbi:NAD(P)-binding domain-containing protein [Gilliamella sp. B2776]|uniref:NADPH-dependent F420 reductase n=1 Tax=unclassified Gilliamella TaxID=2685620 RepID=UPI00226A9A78|nr:MULTISPECIES: NAD(P)-binding domain-containing protein [unclassified Gilliamella]MCX8649323.1 NAD(P)-binding domain-containing protein [Gilliamella sp. B2779]MCX8655063.1 NAD(P)-binding domain-containing protein [Gilliamella sp. B2737]MCX8655836.1 NAD(P)-binding domain-containing protein [Gilliamella sp. B2894]MCX8663939.1 NAD(P)-binding domain-containing protein [Gilliamella sp. B2887]MCX8691182.1 NAD(P)-binding domain-containing protein [Gilliamella sp. B2776]